MKIERIIVVEGRDDTANLKRFFDVDTYETGGSAIDASDIERLKRLQDEKGIVVFTDPDYQGERIRKIIMAAIPDALHAFLTPDEALPKGKGSLGIEHASFESLQAALSDLMGNARQAESDLTQADLRRLGLVMDSDSRKRREYLGERLRIGYSNGKQLLSRLQMFSIKLKQIDEIMSEYNKIYHINSQNHE
ncbi:MAG: ribonuclease M5 [Streptococcaceae bacterium]|nr:ribonuclease M5 [Streptococcaceae bacterium]